MATIINKRDGNAIVKTFSAEVTEIIQLALDRSWIPSAACKFELIEVNNNKLVKIVHKGKCKFRLGVEQHVTLDERPLEQPRLRDDFDRNLKF